MEQFRDSLLYNFANYSELMSCLYILIKCKDHELRQIRKVIRHALGKDFEEEFLQMFMSHCEAYKDFYPLEFLRNLQVLDRKIEEGFKVANEELDIIAPQITRCLFCKQDLQHEQVRYHRATLVSHNSKIKSCKILIRKCVCGALNYPCYAVKDQDRKISLTILSQKYIALTEETVMEKTVLDSMLNDFVFKHSSFMGFAQAHDAMWSNDEIRRDILVDKRLIETWYYFNLIKIYNEINGDLNGFSFRKMEDLDVMLAELRPKLFPHFVTKWSSHQNDHHQNCSKALVFDGNQKVKRMVCFYKEVFVDMEFFGRHQIGYIETPEKGFEKLYIL